MPSDVRGDRLYDRVQTTTEWLDERIDGTPEMALVLGSGLGMLADELEDDRAFAYEAIPHFPVSDIEGHAGELVFGELEGRDVVVMRGRVHYYEGWTPGEVTFPVRTFGAMGIDRFVVTNSAGSANPDYSPGELMLITDHLNLTGANPLRGPNDERFGPRFPDMSEAYDVDYRDLARAAAEACGLSLREGVYAGMAGPSYETPAEIEMIHTIGGDAVGMSTVPEVIVANHMDMRVLGISCITNLGAGLGDEALDHAEVEEIAGRIRDEFADLMREIVGRL
ncbi:MAG: purine-nucleoside phosphorylase [Bradymonadaceae bacterium]